MSLPAFALLGLVPPLTSIALGLWAWRRRRVRRFVSAYAIVVGMMALLIVASFMTISLAIVLLAT